MARIEDMSETQRQSWITLLADGAVFVYLWQAATMGSMRLAHTEMADFGEIILGVIAVTIVLHTVIATIFDMRKRKDDTARDERDIQIERKGAHWGYRLMQYGVGAIIVAMVLQNLVGDDYISPISVEKPAEIIFALMVVSYIADLVKHGVMIMAYRA